MNSECLNNWKLEGAAHMWRYTKSTRHRYSGLNIRCDTSAIRSLVELTKCLADEASGQRTIHLAEPPWATISIPGFVSDFEWFRRIKLSYDREYRGIAFTIVNNDLTLAIGRAGLFALRDALERYDRGDHEFAMPSEVRGGGKYDRAVWFWAAA